ncbi:MAG: DedA family protein [Patescibacteria group bacterium]|mgnify:FL=1
MPITEILIQYITSLIASGGYFFVFLAMVIESTALPLPSEAIMPFAGFLISIGRFSFWGVIIFSAIGSLVGSLFSYYIGLYLGQPFIAKYGKYFLLKPHDLAKTENFFAKHGEKTIFISRFIPIVRHLISLPAGAAKMNVFKFSALTILGATTWNTFLTWVGFALKENWTRIEQYTKYADYFILLAMLVAVVIIFQKRIKKD